MEVQLQERDSVDQQRGRYVGSYITALTLLPRGLETFGFGSLLPFRLPETWGPNICLSLHFLLSCNFSRFKVEDLGLLSGWTTIRHLNLRKPSENLQ